MKDYFAFRVVPFLRAFHNLVCYKGWIKGKMDGGGNMDKDKKKGWMDIKEDR